MQHTPNQPGMPGAVPNQPDPNEPVPNQPDPNQPDPNQPVPNQPGPELPTTAGRDLLAELLWQRYRTTTPPELASSSEAVVTMLGHRSVRRFTPDDVTEAQLATMVATAQSASTSSDVQAWSVIEVRDPRRRAMLADLSNNPVHVRQAPVLLVWVADIARHHTLLEPGEPAPSARFLEAGLVAFLDTALAAQNAAVAAESMGLGICYVGGLRNDPESVARELGLPPHTFALFGMCVGVPDPEKLRPRRPRLPQRAVRHREVYSTEGEAEAMAEHDDAVEAFDHERGVDRGPAGRWTARMRRRLTDVSALHGRDRLRDQMRDQGFPLE